MHFSTRPSICWIRRNILPCIIICGESCTSQVNESWNRRDLICAPAAVLLRTFPSNSYGRLKSRKWFLSKNGKSKAVGALLRSPPILPPKLPWNFESIITILAGTSSKKCCGGANYSPWLQLSSYEVHDRRNRYTYCNSLIYLYYADEICFFFLRFTDNQHGLVLCLTYWEIQKWECTKRSWTRIFWKIFLQSFWQIGDTVLEILYLYLYLKCTCWVDLHKVNPITVILFDAKKSQKNVLSKIPGDHKWWPLIGLAWKGPPLYLWIQLLTYYFTWF